MSPAIGAAGAALGALTAVLPRKLSSAVRGQHRSQPACLASLHLHTAATRTVTYESALNDEPGLVT